MKTILVKDSAGNEYVLPVSELKEFQKLDQEIVADMLESTGITDKHLELCDIWFDKFDKYMK